MTANSLRSKELLDHSRLVVLFTVFDNDSRKSS